MDPNRLHELEHLRYLAQQQRETEELYRQTLEEIFLFAVGITLVRPVFRLTDYPILNNHVTQTLTAFRVKLEAKLINGIREGFARSDRKNAALIKQAYGETLPLPLQSVNQQAFTDFITRHTRRLTLSDRVWRLSCQLQSQIEQTLYVGISEGQPATKMALEAKRYLREPDRLFRRVRDAKGKLVLSEPAKLYHPGAGIYRSSFANALRLTATETNRAYRTADHERWKENKLVLGIEVKLSRSHPTNNETVRCDLLAGKYSKDFKFTGWHIKCLCFATPLLPTKEEYDKYEDAILRGEADSFKFSNVVTGIPEESKQWIRDNQEVFENWKNPPLFIQDNPRLIKKELAKQE